ncbi:hypothetical protein B5G28_02430 [Faecalibacterium sp. An77]|uniref:DHHW family protein n=1 Tax=Faecalibacterium sp. An77 TaxID=1965655 RepID=UPI000B38974B|nr:DHHW family protein [Faecalibacterium sp. An77]OUN40237.1 hypothetical protein B5G28_02430 [Faecalibacterium sp. An77]
MEQKKKRGGLIHYPVLILFSVFFVGVFVLDLLTPDRQVSELENTTLTQRPAITTQLLTAKGLNQFFSNYTQYTKDQIPGRDGWISLQSFVETALFQKTQSGGVLLGDEGQMINRTFGLVSSEERTLPRNIAAVTSLASRYPGKVYTMVVPSAATIYPERVPVGAPLLDETVYLKQIQTAVEEAGGTFVSVAQTLSDHRDEYIYYRTDHHWTTQGAYYAYSHLCSLLGLTPFDLSAHQAVEVPDFYGTFYSRARTWNAQPDTLTYYQLDNPLTIYTVTGPGMPEAGNTTGLYDLSKLEVYDKYAAFLHGNNGMSRVEGDGEGSILVIKDSYANSFVPFLTANYADIDVVDLRNYNYGLDTLIDQNDYDQILVLYSFDSFKSDPYLYRAGIEG